MSLIKWTVIRLSYSYDAHHPSIYPLLLFLSFPRETALLLHGRPQLLQMLDDRHVGVHKAVDAVLRALLLSPVQLTRPERSSDTLLETDIC